MKAFDFIPTVWLVVLPLPVASAWTPSQPANRRPSRRDVFQKAMLGGAVIATALVPSAAHADDVFGKNPLTNSVLEQFRIWEQAEADDLKYGGELERGDAGNRGQVEAYPRLLVPILAMAQDLERIERLVVVGSHANENGSSTRQGWTEARRLLAQPQYEKVAFKKVFNKYGDNIYYSDPDRANVYLGGGATPKTEQSLAYLLRNEILTSIEDLQAELDYLIRTTEDESTEDFQGLIRTARTAMQRYLEVVPPKELQKAKEFLAQEKS